MNTANVYDFKTGTAVPLETPPTANEYPQWAFDYPVAPDYASGCASGAAAALAFLKYLKGKRFSGGTLQRIALGWAGELQAARNEGERSAISGKMVSMFIELETWLAFAVAHGNSEALKNATEASIRATLQDAAEGGPELRYAAEASASRSEAARKAARARWDRREAKAESKSI